MQQKYIYASCKADNEQNDTNCQWCEASKDGPRSQESVTSLNNDGAVIVGKTSYPMVKLCFINVRKKDIQSYNVKIGLLIIKII